MHNKRLFFVIRELCSVSFFNVMSVARFTLTPLSSVKSVGLSRLELKTAS